MLKLQPIIITLIGASAGPAMILGMSRIQEAEVAAQQNVKQGGENFQEMKDLFDLHNDVAQEIGEEEWETSARPGFLMGVTLSTVWDTGTLFPTLDEVNEWIRTHPEEAAEIMERQRR